MMLTISKDTRFYAALLDFLKASQPRSHGFGFSQSISTKVPWALHMEAGLQLSI
jgi:hypothetical protein